MALNLKSIGEKIVPMSKEYGWNDVMLYALGVGAGFNELEYVYEKQLKVIPSFSSAVMPYEVMSILPQKANVDMSGFLHGEQETIYHNPIPPQGTLTCEGSITNIWDKGKDKGAIIRSEFVGYHSNGQKLFTNISTIFCRKDGGFGGDPGPEEIVKFPERKPDFEENAHPSPNQPLLYRLTGDFYQLHIDPDFAKRCGFQGPIMHGLCTHGYACRAIIKHLFPGEPERMTRFRTRFARPIYPGVPIKTLIWKIEEDSALFRVINSENGDIVIDRGIVEWLSKEKMEKRTRLGGINFEDRVAIITGAGRGLGRVYALELAKKGAKVVVNDFGGSSDGSGGGLISPADEVVEEIKAFGGEAVACYDSVTSLDGGRAIVDAAIKAYGRVDIVINNAGVLRDMALEKMEPENWDAVVDVHLKGAYNVTRHAFVYMKKNRYGRIVFTTSASALYGNYGQTNYSAAKMGLVGFMNSLKLEGDKHNIKVNVVAPAALTRLTKDFMPPDMAEMLKPELVAPLVLYLCSEQCPLSGSIYNAGMGYYNRVALLTGPGIALGNAKKIPTLEEIAQNWSAINKMSEAKEFYNNPAAFSSMMEAIMPKKK